MAPQVDLVITFRAIHKQTLSKLQTRDSAQRAEQQYNRLIETLSYAGLHAVGRRGESLGHLLVLVHCPETLLQSLIQREKQSDFLSGLPTTPTLTQGTEDVTVSSADRLRLVHAYITSIPSDGGLGVIPASKEWDLVESVMCLHDRQFNDQWIHAWTTRNYGSVSEEKIRDHVRPRSLIIEHPLIVLSSAIPFHCIFPSCTHTPMLFTFPPPSELSSTSLGNRIRPYIPPFFSFGPLSMSSTGGPESV